MDAVIRDVPDGYVAVGDVVRDVVAEVAANELPLVDRLRRLGDERAVRVLGRRRSGRDLLGFGIDEMVVLASPVVWIVLNEAAARLADGAVTSGSKAVRQWLNRRFSRAGNVAALPTLDPEQIAEVRAQVLDTALRSGMDEDRARLLADSVAGRLVLGALPDPDDPPTDASTQGADDDPRTPS
ncbi:hypothetical protein AB4305_13210 [Nocardia sp. 2YAB30]|uniref:hypothetical protein n=1 Tax=unclassified Nocardia TaxID=2637762 RepID=UPI003F9979EF